jgi:chromosome segregation ATPase
MDKNKTMKEIEQLLDTMLERQERMNDKLAELLVKIDELNTALAEVTELVKDNPNDMELGREVRKFWNNKQ